MRDYSVHLKPDSLKKFSQNSFLPNIKEEKVGKSVFKKILLIFLCIGIILAAIIIFSSGKNILRKFTSKNNFYISPIVSKDELLSAISKKEKEDGGTFSVYIYDINKKNGFGIDENTVMTAASVNKIAILAALYQLAGQGEIDLDKVIILQPDDIQDYGSGSMRYATPGTPYSLKTLARLMMEQSDNTAAYLLANLVLTQDKIQSLVDSWGLHQTNMIDNQTSVKDMSILLTKMYKGEITTKPLTAEMLGFMDKSDFDDRIPQGIPENSGIKIYHKTGDDIGKIHDVGIIDLPDRPYYLGIMTTDTTDVGKTNKTMVNISGLVYNYMKNSQN